ncbi:polycomb group protein EMBRYONIC FLOWER 2-like [Abrus precatorius]|uniref:Polycomb group protein EMBRYONIC FLOWER 2-like n=1 Tax=Abrus precatorius TaxID=3816 RepID=A0A8B8M9Y9_ABRPR|nr:polycomb group protein EMBRYONIC FLOWER 2-like [Abrus precatorius]
MHITEISSTRMAGYPAAACETSYARNTDEPNHEDGCEHLSEEEKLAAEESLSIYCKPVEFYNILQHRMPLFLSRCLDYRKKAKNKKRILMTVSLSWKDDETQSLFPLCICMARLHPIGEDEEEEKYSAVYQTNQIFTFRGSSEIDGNGNTQVKANFMLPENEKLAKKAESGKFFILVYGKNPNSASGANASVMPLDVAFIESRTGESFLFGKLCLQSIYAVCCCNPNFSLGQQTEIMSAIDLLPCILECGVQGKDKSISIQKPSNSEDEVCSSINIIYPLSKNFTTTDLSILKRLQISISAKGFGAEEKSPYHIHASSDVASSSSSRNIRLKEGIVTFNYRYYNDKLRRTEVTEDFCCPFCLVKCASYKGVRCHLLSSHDLFNFEFSASEDCPDVHVSVKSDSWRPEIVADGVDPRVQTFFFCAKPFKRREPKKTSLRSISRNKTDQLLTDPEVPAGDTELLEQAEGSTAIILHPGLDCVAPISEHDQGTSAMDVDKEGVSNAIILHPNQDDVSPISEHDHGTPAEQQVDKKGKLPLVQYDPQIIAKLEKRKFHHSRTYQPMALEEVLSDHDSEDEMYDDIGTEILDRRLLNTIEVSDDAKQFMYMWNIFARKHRVLADGHIHWAYEAFTRFHCKELAQSSMLTWNWRLFMIKLWNQGLLDAKTINKCGIILQEYQKQNSGPKN